MSDFKSIPELAEALKSRESYLGDGVMSALSGSIDGQIPSVDVFGGYGEEGQIKLRNGALLSRPPQP